MNTKFLLVCKEGASLQKYLAEAKECDTQIDVATTVQELFDAATKTAYSGLMIDTPTKIKDFRTDREKIDSILKLYPVIQLTFNETTKQTRTFYSGLLNGSGSIEEFLTDKCSLFNARKLRSSRRKAINFNVILSDSKHVSDSNHLKTVTINFSQDGCFIYSIDNWKIKSDVWFTIKELTDQTPIHGQILRKVDWGSYMSVPGIGLQFKGIKDCQLEDLQAKCMRV